MKKTDIIIAVVFWIVAIIFIFNGVLNQWSVMKKLFILMLFVSLVSCVEKKSCGEIVQKYTDNGKYYFARELLEVQVEMMILEVVMYLEMLKWVKKFMNLLK